MYGSWVLIIAAPPVVVACAVAVDCWTRRGYGLGLLSASALAVAIWSLFTVFQVNQPVSASRTDNADYAIVLAVYLLIGFYVELLLALGAIVETLIARHWRWLAVITLVTLAPIALMIASTLQFVPDVLDVLGIPGVGLRVGSVALLLLPTPTILAYAIARTIRQPLGS
jgi:hypothetical protein